MQAGEDRADVLIIGAGAAGGVAALRLAQAGLKVVTLEQGHWQDAAAYRGSEWDWELAAGKPWSQFPAIRQLASDYPIDVAQSDIQVMNFNGVGGSTILYNAVWIRLLESNFKSRTRHGVGADWPLSYADLAPFYDRTDAEIGVSGLPGNPFWPDSADQPLLPPLPVDAGPLKVARALHRKGWHWWPDANAILSTPHDGRRPCVQRGTCTNGCNEGAKASTDITHWRKAQALGARLITGARVRRITIDAGGLADGAEWIDEEGASHFQAADVVLVAANGIGTPRILLNSACEQFPNGLANRSDQVGRNLMLHPTATVVGVFHDPLESWQGHFGSSIQCLEFAEHDAARGFSMGAKWALHGMGGGPLSDAMRVFDEAGPGAPDYHRRHAEWFGHGQRWSVMTEDLPDPANRVVLSQELGDDAGPAPKVLYRFTENSRKSIAWNIERASETLREAGAWKVTANQPFAAAHLLGTARMGDDPKTSVTDRFGMTHDIPNLGIIDGSLFVTSGPVNPTSTICALALRAAEHVLDIRERLPQPARRAFVAEPAPTRPQIQAPAPPEPLSEVELERLEVLADAIIPADGAMPAAGSISAQPRTLARVLGARPDLLEAVRLAVAEPAPDPAAHLAALKALYPAAYRNLLILVAGGYYLDPTVRTAIGYEGQVPKVQRPDSYPAYIAEGLLDHLIGEAAGA